MSFSPRDPADAEPESTGEGVSGQAKPWRRALALLVLFIVVLNLILFLKFGLSRTADVPKPEPPVRTPSGDTSR